MSNRTSDKHLRKIRSSKTTAQRIRTAEDVEYGLRRLLELDSRLIPINNVAGPLPLRLSNPDFAGLAQIVVSQQVTKQSAAAVFNRLTDSVRPLTPQQFVNSCNDLSVKAGLTRAKQLTLKRIADAIIQGDLKLTELVGMPLDQAICQLTAFKGIGPWTAEAFMLFCGGHPDIFPAHDVALRTAVGNAFHIEPRPTARRVSEIATLWSPVRSVAARLFWKYYAMTRRDTGEA